MLNRFVDGISRGDAPREVRKADAIRAVVGFVDEGEIAPSVLLGVPPGLSVDRSNGVDVLARMRDGHSSRGHSNHANLTSHIRFAWLIESLEVLDPLGEGAV